MAFTKTPLESTYQTKDIKLLQTFETRDPSNTKDNDTVNMYYEVINNRTAGDKEYYVTSRDGTEVYAAVSSEPRGMYFSPEFDRLYIAHGTNVSIYTASTRSLITSPVLFVSTTGEVGFTEFNYPTGEIKIVVTDGSILYTIDSSSVAVPSVSPNLPTPHLPYPVFLDGYLFLVKSGTADIYNSDLDDPLLYTAGSFISAEMLPDNIRRLARINNYIIAMGSLSIEYFFDAANATGSPLQRNDTPIKLVGYVGGFAAWENDIFFMGKAAESDPELYKLSDFKIESLGTPPIRRYLAPVGGTLTFGNIISFQGHEFYVLYNSTLSYMVDLKTKLWTRINYRAGSNFPIRYSVNFSIIGLGFVSVVSRVGTGALLEFTPNNFLDSGVDFNPTVVTDNDMFGTNRPKFGTRLSITADRPTNSSFVTISWSDDDYQTFSTGRQITLNQDYPQLTQLGKFRRRAHKVVHTGNARFRVQNLELDLNMGR
jgi:hypothetical protein